MSVIVKMRKKHLHAFRRIGHDASDGIVLVVDGDFRKIALHQFTGILLRVVRIDNEDAVHMTVTAVT